MSIAGDADDAGGGSRPWRAMGAVMLVAMVSLAGCGGIPFLGGGGPSVDAPDSVTQKISVDPVTVYERVENMTGLEVEQYPNIETTFVTKSDVENQSVPLLRVMAGPRPTRDVTRVVPDTVYNPVDNLISLNHSFVQDSSGARVEAAIAGEFFHAIMANENWTELDTRSNQFVGKIANLSDYDQLMPTQMYGGSSQYIQQSYVDQYLSDSNVQIAPQWGADASVYDMFLTPRARPGMQYFQQTLDSPAGLEDFFSGDLPVRTTEQMLHGNDDEPLPLTMDVTTDNWWHNMLGPSGPQGELATRYALRDQLSTSAATQAAAGWGNDEATLLRSIRDEETQGIVWTHRWDSVEEADQFESALQTFVEGRNAENDDVSFEIRRPTDDTTILIGGEDDFVELVEVSYSGTTVSVSISDPQGTETATPG